MYPPVLNRLIWMLKANKLSTMVYVPTVYTTPGDLTGFLYSEVRDNRRREGGRERDRGRRPPGVGGWGRGGGDGGRGRGGNRGRLDVNYMLSVKDKVRKVFLFGHRIWSSEGL
jgi:hypothetical protein